MPLHQKQVFIRWKQAEREFVFEHCLKMKDKEVADLFQLKFGRKVSVYSIRQQRKRMGIHKSAGRGICKQAKNTGETALSLLLTGME